MICIMKNANIRSILVSLKMWALRKGHVELSPVAECLGTERGLTWGSLMIRQHLVFWKESQKLLPLMELELWGFSPHCSCSFCFPGLCHLRKSFSKRAGGWMSVSEGDCKLIHGAERVEFTGWVSYTPLTPSNDFSGSWDVPAISSSAGAAHLQRKALVKGRSGSQMSWKDKILIG